MKPVLLHSCCAPCSAAILEWMLQNDYAPTIYFYNPNIFPEEEYLKRKNEIIRYALSLNVPIVDNDKPDGNDSWEKSHTAWKKEAEPLAAEPERGARCLLCFKLRLCETARYASLNGFDTFTTTLASSRWKDINQVFEAGRFAAVQHPGVTFWDKNWRKGGLYERRNILAKQFYNQQYCGCEFSLASRGQ